MHDALLTPTVLGDLALANRIVMAPLTRSRARDGDVPWDVTPHYYAQRATGGLIITEATYVDPLGKGYAFVPGITTDAQTEGWRRVVEAVHGAGGRVALQLWHSGRVGHTELTGGHAPVAPSAIGAQTKTYTPTSGGMVDVAEPRALGSDEIPNIVDAFRKGAENAKSAGFDGVEIHGANGYLLDQFVRDGSNTRDDDYGGSAQNRTRLPLEVAAAVADVFGPGRVGYRISPLSPFNDMRDRDPAATFGHLAEGLGKLGLAYLHVVEDTGDWADDAARDLFAALASRFKTAGGQGVIANNAYTPEAGAQAVSLGRADAVAYGKLFLANPDLPRRIEQGGPFNEADPATFYGGDERGYTDYPSLTEPTV